MRTKSEKRGRKSMKSVLIAVDNTKATLRAVELFHDLFDGRAPERTILVYVEKMEGPSLMDDMLGEAELSTLREELKGTRYQAMLDTKAKKILQYFSREIEAGGVNGLETVIREGHPAEEILKVAKDEDVGLILVGARSSRAHGFLMGSVSREVANGADRPVLIAR